MSVLRQDRSSNSQRRFTNQQEEQQNQDVHSSKAQNEKKSSQSIRQTQSQQSHKQYDDDPKLAIAQMNQGELKKVMGEGRLDEYGEEEEEIICLRFPHLQFCPHNYQSQLRDTIFAEVIEGVYLCGFAAGLATKFLLAKGITHILNVTATEYTKRTKYFKYLTLDVFNTSDEDIKKHFRITNRFIKTSIQSKGKVLIHSNDGVNIGPCFILSYMINNLKIPLKVGVEQIKLTIPELTIAQHFMKQLEQYDLEKLALVSLKKQEIL